MGDDEIKERAARLKQARQRVGLKTLKEVYEKYPRWSKDSYKSHENGNGTFSFKRAEVYASAFGVRAEWLYSGTEPMLHPPPQSPAVIPLRRRARPARTVPLVGYVAAGSEMFFIADGSLGEVDAPEGANESTVAAEVRGTSLGPLFERWLIFYDEVRRPVTTDLIGRLCIVGLPDGRVMVKQIQKARGDGMFHLLSNNEPPLLDQGVEWAARVRTMTPR